MMSDQAIAKVEKYEVNSGSILLGTGLVVASFILFPALASRMGLGSSVTGAVRIALMRASSRAINGKSEDGADASTGGFSCH